jgi:hypothetical protein
MDDGHAAIRTLEPKPSIPHDLMLLRNLSAPFDTGAKILLCLRLKIVQIIVLPRLVQGGITHDHMGDLTTQQRIYPQVVKKDPSVTSIHRLFVSGHNRCTVIMSK